MSDIPPKSAPHRKRLTVFDNPAPIPTEEVSPTAIPDLEPYERLDRTTGWFSWQETPEPHMCRLSNKGKIRDGLIEARDRETGKRAWIEFTVGHLGLRKPSHGVRLPYWQISVEQAVDWFGENGVSPPDALLEDRLVEQGRTKGFSIEDEKPGAVDASGAVTTKDPAEMPEVKPIAPAASGSLSPAARAIAAAYDLQREGKPVSLQAACNRAKVDRGHLREKYPEAAATIQRIATPDRVPKRGVRDRRSGDIDALDDRDE